MLRIKQYENEVHDIALKTGMKVSLLKKIIDGEQEPSYMQAMIIADAIGVAAENLFATVPEDEPQEPVELTMSERAVKAAKKYLENVKGYRLIDTVRGYPVYFDDEDGERITVVNVEYSKDGWDGMPIPRKEFEQIMFEFFSNPVGKDKYLDLPIQQDLVDLHVLDGGRALVRHTINIKPED